jgi:hypothetical protein
MNRTALVLIVTSALGGAVLGVVGGCSGTRAGPAVPKPSSEAAPTVSPVVSSDILAREPISNTAMVKHILISWHDLGDAFQGHIDPRAEKRSKADAEAEVRALVKQLQDGADFDTLMKAHSEDTSSAMSGRAFTVEPNSQLVIEFRQLSLRLRPGEFGVCQSDFGFHIIKRIS